VWSGLGPSYGCPSYVSLCYLLPRLVRQLSAPHFSANVSDKPRVTLPRLA
jgi:hypothetical protein